MRKRYMSLAGILVMAVIALILWNHLSSPVDTPVEAIPQDDYPPADVAFFLQNDPQWASDTLGDSEFKLAGSGCLVNCIASSLAAQGIDTDPKRLNEAFSKYEVYNSEGEIIWDSISSVFPGIRITAPGRADAASLEKAVAQGLLPIVKVKYHGTGYQHWVLLIGTKDGDYLCMDPLNAHKQPLPLSDHGGVIYRYRIILVKH